MTSLTFSTQIFIVAIVAVAQFRYFSNFWLGKGKRRLADR